MQSNYASVDDVAEKFKTTRQAIYQKIKRGAFPKGAYFKVGKRLYFNPEKLTKWIEEGGAL